MLTCAARRASRNPNPSPMATGKKHEITVTTRTTYIPEPVGSGKRRYVFAYTITLKEHR